MNGTQAPFYKIRAASQDGATNRFAVARVAPDDPKVCPGQACRQGSADAGAPPNVRTAFEWTRMSRVLKLRFRTKRIFKHKPGRDCEGKTGFYRMIYLLLPWLISRSSAASVSITALTLWTQTDKNRAARCLEALGWERYRERQGARLEWRYQRESDQLFPVCSPVCS